MNARELPFGEGLLPLVLALGEPGRTAYLEGGRDVAGGGRYSIFGYKPVQTITATGGGVRIVDHATGETVLRAGDPWALLCAFDRARRRPAGHSDLPLHAGGIGYFSYESGLGWEGVAEAKSDARQPAPFSFAYFDGLLIADAKEQRLWAVADTGSTARDAALLDELARDAATARERNPRQGLKKAGAIGDDAWLGAFTSDFPRPDYLRAVESVRAYIASGDVYQVNLAQRFSASWSPGREHDLFVELRRRSPAPYASLIDVGGEVVAVGCSPERFLRVRGDFVSTRPIKGTRPRGKTPAEDAALRLDLLESEKDRAELLMIVDLERNDLGRVCVPGSIRVEGLNTLEEHPTVFHLVAEVTGRLAPARDALDVIRASFPGGSITGAPKIRAMQVIAELEPYPRGVYTGAVGYLGSRGESEFAIAIRTVQCVGDRVFFHAGSGVVWDSSPEAEYEECLAKARAMGEAVVAVKGIA